VADLKLMIERISEREKNSIRNQLTEAERKAELEVRQAKTAAAEKLVEEKEKITNDLKYEFQMKENTQDVTYRNAVLREKQKVIQKVLRDATKKLNEISTEDFMKLVASALENIDVTQRAELFVGEHSKGLMDDEWLNDHLPWNHHVVVQDETVKNKAGLLIQQGNVDYNYFFDDLIAENRQDLLPYITTELFED
jgi:vacuolar-type H+-ATPase subunit E/Vma4